MVGNVTVSVVGPIILFVRLDLGDYYRDDGPAFLALPIRPPTPGGLKAWFEAARAASPDGEVLSALVAKGGPSVLVSDVPGPAGEASPYDVTGSGGDVFAVRDPGGRFAAWHAAFPFDLGERVGAGRADVAIYGHGVFWTDVAPPDDTDRHFEGETVFVSYETLEWAVAGAKTMADADWLAYAEAEADRTLLFPPE